MSEGEFNSRQWISDRQTFWRRVEADTPALVDNKPVSIDAVNSAIVDYPELARDLAIARNEAPGSPLTAQLERLYRTLHRALHQPARWRKQDLWHYLSTDVPTTAFALRWQIFSTTVGFFVCAILGWMLVAQYPDMAGLFASPGMIETVQRGELWTDGLLNVMPSSILSIQIFTNNVMVCLMAMSLGVLYGLGTIYIIALNGMMLGSVFSFVHQYGLSDELFTFVVAHGCVELSIIFIAAAVGFSLGEAIARPGHLSRMASFQRAMQTGGRFMILLVLFMIGAGIIEGYVSPNPAFPLWSRVVIGVTYWLFFVWTLMGLPGLRRHEPRPV